MHHLFAVHLIFYLSSIMWYLFPRFTYVKHRTIQNLKFSNIFLIPIQFIHPVFSGVLPKAHIHHIHSNRCLVDAKNQIQQYFLIPILILFIQYSMVSFPRPIHAKYIAIHVGFMFITLNLAIILNSHTIELSSILWCPHQGPHAPYIEQHTLGLC